MYKVFFNDRALFLTDDFSTNFRLRYGLFFKYKDKEGLDEIIDIYSKLSSVDSLILFHHDLDVLRTDFRSSFTSIDAAGGLIQNKKGEYLFIYRRGKWDLPKGKVDPGENYQQAALREVEEETGLKNVTINKPLLSTYHTYPYKSNRALKKTYWFSMMYDGEDAPIPQVEEDIEDIRWFKRDELFIPLDNTYGLVFDILKYEGIIE